MFTPNNCVIVVSESEAVSGIKLILFPFLKSILVTLAGFLVHLGGGAPVYAERFLHCVGYP